MIMKYWNSYKNKYILAFCLALLFAIMIFPAPDGISNKAKGALAVFAVAIILWVSNALPLAVTGVLIITLIPLLKIMPPEQAFALFGNQAVFFILGALIIATAMTKSGLSRRMALLILSHFDKSPRYLILGILVTCAFMSFIMPEHVVAALMFPVIVSIVSSLDIPSFGSDYGTVLFLSMAWGAIIGGVGTLLGGARNPLAIAIMEERFHVTISFFEWMKAVCPLSFLLLGICYIIILISFKIEIKDVNAASKKLKEELSQIGSLSFLEKKILFIIILTISLWIFASPALGIAVISLLSVILLFSFECLNWDDVHQYVNWGIILMYGGAVVLAKALEYTGATYWLVKRFIGLGPQTPFFTLIFFALLAKLLTEGVSNVACVAIILPIAISLCPAMGISPKVMVYFVAVSSGLAFILPISSPPNAIAYSSGYYEISKVIKPGLILSLLTLIAFILMTLIYWPFIGLKIW